jgi:hypothetical protein
MPRGCAPCWDALHPPAAPPLSLAVSEDCAPPHQQTDLLNLQGMASQERSQGENKGSNDCASRADGTLQRWTSEGAPVLSPGDDGLRAFSLLRVSLWWFLRSRCRCPDARPDQSTVRLASVGSVSGRSPINAGCGDCLSHGAQAATSENPREALREVASTTASAVIFTIRRTVEDGVRMCAGRAAPSRMPPTVSP